MVKIFELSDNQLDSQLKKYKKIIDELIKEKTKRLKMDVFEIDLDFDKRKMVNSRDGDITEKSEIEGLSFNETDIRSMKEVSKDFEIQSNQEEVNVTKLLKISKEELKKLKN